VSSPRAVDWAWACPGCRSSIALGDDPDEAHCPACGSTFRCVDGVWGFLPPERQERFARFLIDYLAVRMAEGRGSDDPAYYLRLPEPTADHPLAWQWTIRAATWRHLQRRVLGRLGSGLRVIDLGAGVGWLSHRLAERGHQPVAIDLLVDDLDGLGAARHYAPVWPRAQAEFDRLPLGDGSVDLVVYNASLHYSTDCRTTLAEALRVLRPGGHVMVLETPIYHHERSGQAMVAERHRQFAERYGTRSESIPSIEYLTDGALEGLGRDLGLRWQRTTPWYGWAWWWRPYRARFKRKREPSRFQVLVAQKQGP
jgi:SAM-dependent methyltransferase